MRMKGLAVTIAVAGLCAAWAIAGAAADGGPGPGISIGGTGVTGPGGQLRYVTLPAGSGTVLEAIRTRDGAVLRWATIPGTFGIPLVAFDGSGGSAGGLSRDLKTLILASPPGPPGPAVGQGTRFAVVDTRTLKTRVMVDLPGGYSYDALSPDAATLYLIQYTSARNVNRYRVRAYDLVARRPLAGAIVDRREPGPMTGSPMTRLTSTDGRWAYTLYSTTIRAIVRPRARHRGTASCLHRSPLARPNERHLGSPADALRGPARSLPAWCRNAGTRRSADVRRSHRAASRFGCAIVNRRAFLVAAGVPLLATVAPRGLLAMPTGGGVVALATADLEAHLVAVEVGSGRIVKRIATAAGPRSIESNAFGQVVVAHTARGRLTIVDAATLSVLGEIDGLGEPRYIAMHPSERIAYVSDSGRGEVVTIDLVRRAIVHRARVPGPTRHISVSSDGRWLWTALGTKARALAVLGLSDSHRPQFVRTFAPPFLAHDVVFTPDSEQVWVTSGSKSAIAVYSRSGSKPTQLLPADAPPQHVAFSGARAYVSSGDDGTVRIHRLDGSLIRTTSVPVGSYNMTYGSFDMTFGQPLAVTPSLDLGTVCILSPAGAVRTIRKIARSAHDACVVEAG